MTITTMLFCSVARDRWQLAAVAGAARSARCSWSVDLAFLGANLVKIAERRLVPARWSRSWSTLLMTTWKRGRQIVAGILRESSLPIDLFLSDIAPAQAAAGARAPPCS